MISPSPAYDLTLLKKWMPVVLWLGLIFYFSTDQFSSSNMSQVLGPMLERLFPGIPVDRISFVHSLLRKFGHWGEYLVLSLLLLRALRDSHADWKTHHTALSIMFVFFYAASDEFHQSFVPSRTASVNDILIDLFGGICGIFWMILRAERKPSAAKQHARRKE
jgi:VanZ family protein